MKSAQSMPRQPDKASLEKLFEETRKDDRRMYGDLMSTWLERLAGHITFHRLSCTETAELLRQKATTIQQEVMD